MERARSRSPTIADRAGARVAVGLAFNRGRRVVVGVVLCIALVAGAKDGGTKLQRSASASLAHCSRRRGQCQVATQAKARRVPLSRRTRGAKLDANLGLQGVLHPCNHGCRPLRSALDQSQAAAWMMPTVAKRCVICTTVSMGMMVRLSI